MPDWRKILIGDQPFLILLIIPFVLPLFALYDLVCLRVLCPASQSIPVRELVVIIILLSNHALFVRWWKARRRQFVTVSIALWIAVGAILVYRALEPL